MSSSSLSATSTIENDVVLLDQRTIDRLAQALEDTGVQVRQESWGNFARSYSVDAFVVQVKTEEEVQAVVRAIHVQPLRLFSLLSVSLFPPGQPGRCKSCSQSKGLPTS